VLTYQATIGPLLKERCGACHSPEGGIQDLDLTTYEGTLAGGASGPAVIPGDAENSPILIKQTGEQPHFGQFTPQEIDWLVEWINAGAPAD
jgi:mono/diheme cytochrome c family protein